MLDLFKKILISGVFFYPQIALCQNIDIPEFMDEDDPEMIEEEVSTQATTAVTPPAPIPESKPKVENPNLGRNEKPLERLVYSHAPLPELSIDLTPEPIIPPPTPKEWPAISLTNEKPESFEAPSTIITGTTNSLDARDYELEGFALGMTPLDIGKIALENGYKISKSEKGFPLFLTTQYDQECRAEGYYLPNEIRTCIRQKGKKDKSIFLKTMTISKPGGRESYFFEFTSPATENRAWRITYYNKGDNSLNFTPSNKVKKLNRRDQFFNAVFNKFGYPSDSKDFIWGDKNDAFMQVSMYGSNYDAQITLTDTVLSDDDYFEAKEWLDEHPNLEQFSFGE